MGKAGGKAYGIWFIGSLFYLYELFVRVIPSLLGQVSNSPVAVRRTKIVGRQLPVAGVGVSVAAYSDGSVVLPGGGAVRDGFCIRFRFRRRDVPVHHVVSAE